MFDDEYALFDVGRYIAPAEPVPEARKPPSQAHTRATTPSRAPGNTESGQRPNLGLTNRDEPADPELRMTFDAKKPRRTSSKYRANSPQLGPRQDAPAAPASTTQTPTTQPPAAQPPAAQTPATQTPAPEPCAEAQQPTMSPRGQQAPIATPPPPPPYQNTGHPPALQLGSEQHTKAEANAPGVLSPQAVCPVAQASERLAELPKATMQRFIAEFLVWADLEKEKLESAPGTARVDVALEAPARTKKRGKDKISQLSSSRQEVAKISDELKHAGGLLASGLSELQQAQDEAAATRMLEGSAVALMSAMSRLSNTAKALDHVMITDMEGPENFEAAASSSAKNEPAVSRVVQQSLAMADQAGSELLARAYTGKAALMSRMEALEAQMFQAKASKRVTQRKLQEQRVRSKEASHIKEASRAQMSTLANLVKKAQSEKMAALRSLSSMTQENQQLRQQLAEQAGDLETARYENQRINRRCENLEARLINSTVAPSPPPTRRSSPPRGGSAASQGQLSMKTRSAYSHPRVGPSQGSRRPLTARSVQSEGRVVQRSQTTSVAGPGHSNSLAENEQHFVPGRQRPMTAR